MSKPLFLSISLAAILAVMFTNGLMAENSTKYLPMTEGRFWEYEIKVPEGGNSFSLRHIIYDDRLVYATRSQNPLVKEGTYALRYAVKGKTENPNVWEIKVEKDTLKLYSDVEKVFWEFEKSEKGHVMITERLVFTRQFAMMNNPSSSFMPALKAESSNLMFFEQAKDEHYAIESQETTYSYLNQGVKVDVPAGKFSDCVVVAEEVNPSDKLDEAFPPSFGWITLSVWSPDIGLVRKTQLSTKKKILWTMDLIDYGVK